jgi:uncharacterized membrane protein YhhN
MNWYFGFLIIFAAVSVSHIAAIFLRKEGFRRVSKVLILPPLLGAYIAGAGTPVLFPVLALLLGWAGDILLLGISRPRYFMLGLGAFLLGHICYAISFTAGFVKGIAAGFGALSVPALAVFAAAMVPLGLFVFRFIRPGREMTLPVILYMAVIEVMSFFSFALFLYRMDAAGALVFAGSLCFMISDAILGYYTFRTLALPGAVLIMVFYILAQAAIVLGLAAF